MIAADAVPALKLYFSAFIFMDLQYIGQTVFKSLNKRKQAIFFSLLRKVFIVVPLTYLLPYTFHMGTASADSAVSELKTPIKYSGARMITLHMRPV